MQAYEIDIVLSQKVAACGIVVEKDINHTFHGAGSDARAAWESFKAVAHEPSQPWVEDDGRRIEFGHGDEDDLLLFRADVDEVWSEEPWMPDAPPGPSVFRLTFVRRIWSGPEPDRNSTRFELHLVVEFSLSPQLRDLAAANENRETQGYGPGGNSSELVTLSQWIANVEASKGFNTRSTKVRWRSISGAPRTTISSSPLAKSCGRGLASLCPIHSAARERERRWADVGSLRQ